MATTNQNGINFTNIYKSGGILHGDTIKQDSWKETSAYPSEDNFPLVNAIDIDWNGAVLPNGNISNASSVTINTTGDLLKLINDMQQEIYTLAAAVIAIGSK